MTPEQLVDPKESPGATYVFGTDTRSNKDWQKLATMILAVGPSKQVFGVAASTWTWTHNFGYEPMVEAYDSTGDQITCSIQHTSVNQLVATFTYNATGFLLAR